MAELPPDLLGLIIEELVQGDTRQLTGKISGDTPKLVRTTVGRYLAELRTTDRDRVSKGLRDLFTFVSALDKRILELSKRG